MMYKNRLWTWGYGSVIQSMYNIATTSNLYDNT